uniref:LIM zinc-binding domain-containing protein n=1 Tax=Anopheles epiroticus TaxID=199890 RepID=A0A182PH07_9DIPT
MAAASSNSGSISATTTNNNNNIITSNNNNNNNNTIHIETDEFIKKSRVTRAAPPKPAYDPLQFVQIKPAKLYDLNKAKPSTERKLEVKAQREVVEDAEEWQCNLDNWKSSRRKRVEHIIDKITEAKKIEQEEVCRGRKKSKTFSEMLENSGSRRRFILPENEDDDGSFSDDLHDPRDGSKQQQYKDESTDDRATDDTSSCCSSKLADGESKTPDLDDGTHEVPEMNEFSLAIENYKSKFPMTQSNRVTSSSVLASSVTTTNTSSSVVSSIESNGNESNILDDSNDVQQQQQEHQSAVEVESMAQQLSTTCLERDETTPPLVTVKPMESRMQMESERPQEEDRAKQEQSQEDRPKVNVIERRRLFEQFQQMAHTTTAPVDTTPPAKPTASPTIVGGGQQERPLDDTSTSGDESGTARVSSSEWLAEAGIASIRERRAIFERYQSNEMIAEENNDQHLGVVGGRSRSSSTTVVVKSRSESNVGFINGSTGRFELALNQLKRNAGGQDCCEDSGIQSTTDLSRSSVVSQADENDPPSSLSLLTDDMLLMAGKSPARSTTLDSASEFSDTDCSNGQQLDNALDVAFEEMDSELNESGTAESHQQRDQEPEIVPLSVIPLATDYMPANEETLMSDEQLVLMSLPKSTLTPPKEKPPPPPVEEESELEPQPLTAHGAVITSWMQKGAMHTNGNGHTHDEDLVDDYAENAKRHLADEHWRSLESYEVVQQVQHQQQQQRKQHEQDKEPERDKDQQEMLVYSNRIESNLPHHHQQLYDPGEHEEIVSVERELLQIEQEELQRRREKQMFYDKLTKADGGVQAVGQPQHPAQLQQQSHPPTVHQAPSQPQQQPYYYPHHPLSHQPHHHNRHQLHHRASMPAIDSRSLQNVNSYTSYETPFLDSANSGYEIGSLHRESMPNLSHVTASSSHPSSLSSYGEEFSVANSAGSYDGTCWPPVEQLVPHRPGPAGRPAVAPRPAMNGALLPGAAGGYHGGGGGPRMSNNLFEHHPKDNKQNTHPSAMSVNRGQGTSIGGHPNQASYGQHWLVQEAEQRRIEQHQKNSTNSSKRPLPKFVIDAITQRVQKLNAASPENSDRSNLSEDSDLAMINSMKNHHHHHASLPPPPPSSHPHTHHPLHPHQQQQPPQQQKYPNTSDKVLSVSGKKECSHCRIELGKGAAMAIESLGLFYHIECFKCCVCHVKLGDGTNGIDVRVRKYRLHCQNCFSSEDGVKFSCDEAAVLDSPDASSAANVSSCVWYLPDQRGCLVYPVRRITLADWFCIPESTAQIYAEHHPDTQPINDELVQLIVTLETSNSSRERAEWKEQEEDFIMLNRFGRFLAWRLRKSHSLEILLETDASRTFQLITATFGSGRFDLDAGSLKLVQLESVETLGDPMPFQEPANVPWKSQERSLSTDGWLSDLLSHAERTEIGQCASQGIQPDIISSNDIKISLEMMNGTVISSQSRADLLSSGSNSRNRSQLDLTDGLMSTNGPDLACASETVENGTVSRSTTDELIGETEQQAIVSTSPTAVAIGNDEEKNIHDVEVAAVPPTIVEELKAKEVKPKTPNVEPPPVEVTSNGTVKHHTAKSNPPPVATNPLSAKNDHIDAFKPKPTRSLRKSSFPSSRLRLGTDQSGIVSKPPNILVHSDSSSTMEYVIATLNNLLEPNTYTIYPITTGQAITASWLQSTVLIIVAGSLDMEVRKILLDYFLHGGTVFSLCSDLLDIILPDSKTAEIRERELVSFSYRKWKQIKMLHHIFCYQLSPAKKQFSLESEETSTLLPISYVDVTDRKGKPHSLAVEILAQEETWNTPSILEAHNRKTGGRAIFSQIHLELDPSQFQSNIDGADNSLQNSNQLRYEILSDLLGSRIGLKLREKGSGETSIVYKNAYFLGKHEAKVQMLDSLKSTMSRPNVIQMSELTLQFCGKSDSTPNPATDSHLPVMIFHCPEDFSTVEYFENLTTKQIGRIGIYAPIMTSSMHIVSNLTLTHGFMVIARYQTKGKGRSNNQWLSPPGCAMFSLQLQIPMNSMMGRRLPVVQHLVAIAIVSAILSIPGYELYRMGGRTGQTLLWQPFELRQQLGKVGPIVGMVAPALDQYVLHVPGRLQVGKRLLHAPAHLPDDRFGRLRLERELTAQQLVPHRAERVNVGGLRERQIAFDRSVRCEVAHQLGRQIAQPAAGNAQPELAIQQLGGTEQSKVGDDHLAVLEEDVLRLQVLMDDAPRVQIAHTLRDLLRHQRGAVQVELVLPQVDRDVTMASRGGFMQAPIKRTTFSWRVFLNVATSSLNASSVRSSAT